MRPARSEPPGRAPAARCARHDWSLATGRAPRAAAWTGPGSRGASRQSGPPPGGTRARARSECPAPRGASAATGRTAPPRSAATVHCPPPARRAPTARPRRRRLRCPRSGRHVARAAGVLRSRRPRSRARRRYPRRSRCRRTPSGSGPARSRRRARGARGMCTTPATPRTDATGTTRRSWRRPQPRTRQERSRARAWARRGHGPALRRAAPAPCSPRRDSPPTTATSPDSRRLRAAECRDRNSARRTGRRGAGAAPRPHSTNAGAARAATARPPPAARRCRGR